jgi:hypothetical protein
MNTNYRTINIAMLSLILAQAEEVGCNGFFSVRQTLMQIIRPMAKSSLSEVPRS